VMAPGDVRGETEFGDGAWRCEGRSWRRLVEVKAASVLDGGVADRRGVAEKEMSPTSYVDGGTRGGSGGVRGGGGCGGGQGTIKYTELAVHIT
jgi:hypothetical protein